jgi:hypothetical protein
MSKLVLSGSTSGSVTLSSPAVSGTTTLTLPTTSGTVIASDSSGNVGIGTTTPTGKLDITQATNGNAFVVNALGGETPNFTVQGSGEQTFRLYNNASTGSTRTSIKLASRLNTDWEWIAFTDNAGTGVNDLTISNLAGQALIIDASRNLRFNSGYGSVATAYGCRAWVNFNGTGTVAIRASGNVTSITDNGTGDYTINFTTAMPDTNYSCVGSIKEGANTTAINSIFTPAIYATGNIRVLTNNGATPVDMVNANVTIFR